MTAPTNSCGHTGASFLYSDPSNIAVTNSARPLCVNCYTTRYGTPHRRPQPDDLHWSSGGVLGTHNLLTSGDYPDRDSARSRFTVRMTGEGSRVA